MVATREQFLEEFVAKVQAGHKVEHSDEIPEEYKEALLNLMLQQADSELAGAYGYIPWIEKAPNIHEKLLVAQIVKDEVRHAFAMYKLLGELGVDVDDRIAQQDFAYRLNEANADIGTERKAQDKRVNIFYYPIETWTDFIMFNFCMDRGAGHQLEDALDSSYAPWMRAIKTIFQDEVMHMNHGDTWVTKLAADPATRPEVQEALNKWFPRTMNIFGSPKSRKNEVYRKFGLKKRTNEEVRQAFKAEIEKKIEGTGLTLPEWTPNYDESV
jgi:ring-1,2-phenylacetyl-CoA epoxidase subunit PaaA